MDVSLAIEDANSRFYEAFRAGNIQVCTCVRMLENGRSVIVYVLQPTTNQCFHCSRSGVESSCEPLVLWCCHASCRKWKKHGVMGIRFRSYILELHASLAATWCAQMSVHQ